MLKRNCLCADDWGYGKRGGRGDDWSMRSEVKKTLLVKEVGSAYHNLAVNVFTLLRNTAYTTKCCHLQKAIHIWSIRLLASWLAKQSLAIDNKR